MEPSLLYELVRGQYRGKTDLSKQLLAYISGFLDGDGCIMAQLVYRKDYSLGYQIRLSIVFYQKEKHIKFLEYLKDQLKYGYIRIRKDGMAEYTIVGHDEVRAILEQLLPYLKLKQELARLAIKISKVSKKPNREELLRYAKLVDQSAGYNYSKKRKITSKTLEAYLESKSVPVTTDLERER